MGPPEERPGTPPGRIFSGSTAKDRCFSLQTGGASSTGRLRHPCGRHRCSSSGAEERLSTGIPVSIRLFPPGWMQEASRLPRRGDAISSSDQASSLPGGSLAERWLVRKLPTQNLVSRPFTSDPTSRSRKSLDLFPPSLFRCVSASELARKQKRFCYPEKN